MTDKTQTSGLLLDRRTAAATLGVCVGMLQRIDLPKTKIGRRTLYRRDVLESWIEKHTEKNTSTEALL